MSRDLLKNIPINHENVSVVKHSIQMLGDTQPVSLIQDGVESYM